MSKIRFSKDIHRMAKFVIFKTIISRIMALTFVFYIHLRLSTNVYVLVSSLSNRYTFLVWDQNNISTN